MSQKEQAQRIKGVFSTQEIRRIGTGTTTRRTVQKNFWFIETQADGSLESQPLNSNLIPSGPKRKVTLEEVIEKFAPEPEFYMNSVFPKMQELKKSIEEGDAYREKGSTFAAEHEFDKALTLDEESVRANFGIGLTYLQRGESDRAENIFQRLLQLDAAFSVEHKHLFNEFGISMRKNKMYTQAIDYYKRALELSQHDENLHINLARAYLETRAYSNCIDHLMQSLALAPQNESTMKFLEWMLRRKLIPAEMQQKVAKAMKNTTPLAAEQDGEQTKTVQDEGGQEESAASEESGEA